MESRRVVMASDWLIANFGTGKGNAKSLIKTDMIGFIGQI